MPFEFGEAVADLLKVKPPPKPGRKAAGDRVVKKKKPR
jgi:hypothetical protein